MNNINLIESLQHHISLLEFKFVDRIGASNHAYWQHVKNYHPLLHPIKTFTRGGRRKAPIDMEANLQYKIDRLKDLHDRGKKAQAQVDKLYKKK